MSNENTVVLPLGRYHQLLEVYEAVNDESKTVVRHVQHYGNDYSTIWTNDHTIKVLTKDNEKIVEQYESKLKRIERENRESREEYYKDLTEANKNDNYLQYQKEIRNLGFIGRIKWFIKGRKDV